MRPPPATTPTACVPRLDELPLARTGAPQPPPLLPLVLALLVAAVAALSACPKLPPVSGCTPFASRCDGDRPQVCSPTQRWYTVGDSTSTCASLGTACVVSDAGVARCVPADAGGDR